MGSARHDRQARDTWTAGQRRKHIHDTDTRTVWRQGKTRQDRQNRARRIGYLDRHNSGQRLHELLLPTVRSGASELAFAGSKTHVLHLLTIVAAEDVDAQVAVRAKCRPRLAVKRWRLAPTHPLQAEATLFAAAAAVRAALG